MNDEKRPDEEGIETADEQQSQASKEQNEPPVDTQGEAFSFESESDLETKSDSEPEAKPEEEDLNEPESSDAIVDGTDSEEDSEEEEQSEPEDELEEEEATIPEQVSQRPYTYTGDSEDFENFEDLEDSGNASQSQGLFLFLAVLVLTGFGAMKLWLSGQLGLGDSEAYYYAWSQHLQLSYYDHPPMVAYLISLGTRWFGDTTMGVRVLSVALSTAMGLGVYGLGASLFRSHRVGFVALLFFLLTPVFFLGSIAAAPDAGLGVMWLLASWLLYRAAHTQRPLYLLLTGAAVGIGLLCKYFMLLFWPVAIVYLLFSPGRKLLVSIWLPLALVLSAAIFAPVLIWNSQHDFISFTYHLFERHQAASFDLNRLLVFTAGQALYLSPLLFLGLLLAAGRSLWDLFGRTGHDAGLLFWLSVPVLGFFVFVGGWTGESEPHWPLIGYLLLYPLLASMVLSIRCETATKAQALLLVGPFAFWRQPKKRRAVMSWLLLPALAINGLLVAHLLSAFPSSLLPDEWYDAKYDLANELIGWDRVDQAIGEISSKHTEPLFVASYHYTMCGQLSFALRGRALPVYCLSERTDAFDFFEQPSPVGQDGLIVTDNRYNTDPSSLYSCGGGLTKLREIPIQRGERQVRLFTLWQCTNYQGLGSTSPEPIEQAPLAVEAKPILPAATDSETNTPAMNEAAPAEPATTPEVTETPKAEEVPVEVEPQAQAPEVAPAIEAEPEPAKPEAQQEQPSETVEPAPAVVEPAQEPEFMEL